MLKTGLLNPAVLSLLARVRHTNTLVIADRGFPFWPQIETIDLSLVDGVPTVLQVLNAIRPNFVIGRAFAARLLTEPVISDLSGPWFLKSFSHAVTCCRSRYSDNNSQV